VNELQRRCAAAALLLLGLVGVGGGGTLWAQAWLQGWTWAHSDAARQAASQAAQPTPIWEGEIGARPTAVVTRRATPVPLAVEAAPTMTVASQAPTPVPTPAPATADQIELQDIAFEFLEPPEPGATARLTVTAHNTSDRPSPPLSLAIPGAWFKSYRLFNAVPAVEAEDTDGDGSRALTFPAIDPGATELVQLQLVSTAESLEAPHVTVGLVGGDVVGDAQPTTLAPRPRPGPAAAVSIPRLNLKAGVLPTDWEPPSFVVGQLKTSASVSTGNTVLIGHLTGAAGNVFAHLDRLAPGDAVTATSRGVDYRFVVSEIDRLPETDLHPLDPTDSPRLTLMTCTGWWNPITRDYSERLWVIAEPAEQAAATIAANKAKAEQEAAARATATALAPTPEPTPAPTEPPRPTATPVAPTPTPTPFAAEVAPPGGLGNTRRDVDRTFGPPRGETSGKLVVYKAGPAEMHVWYSPDPPRAAAVVVVEPTAAPLSLEAAIAQSRPLLPLDTQPRAPRPEGNADYVVERFTSPTLAKALPDGLFEAGNAQPGDFLVVYEKNAQGAVRRVVVGIGDDIDALIERTST
jgi:LPXTG-site transpeptidase (sortase) family protein